MTTTNSATDRGVTDAEVITAYQSLSAVLHIDHTDTAKFMAIRNALESFAQSRQSSAQGGEKVEPPIERVMGDACANCHGSGIGMDGKPCPFAPHKQVTYKLRATNAPKAGGLVGDAKELPHHPV